MDPITLGLMLGGGMIEGFGKIFGGFSEGRTRATTAALFDQQAIARIEKGEFDAAQSRRRFNRQQGETIAAIGTTGVDASSFLDVLMDDASEAALEREAIRHTARAEADQLRFQGREQRRAAKGAVIGSLVGAAASVVNSVAGARYRSSGSTTGGSAGVSTSTPFDF